jgi:hypothetical protein
MSNMKTLSNKVQTKRMFILKISAAVIASLVVIPVKAQVLFSWIAPNSLQLNPDTSSPNSTQLGEKMEKLNRLKLLVAGSWLLLSISTINAEAALLSRAGGTMVYDTDLDITWVADANLFATQVAQAGGQDSDYVRLKNEIITANGGVIYDSPNYRDSPDRYSGIYTLNQGDFHFRPGLMNWFAAQAWANSLVYGGYSDWRLPTTIPEKPGYNQSDSEMGHLFYSELGGIAGKTIADSHNANYDLFSNLGKTGINAYWSGTEGVPPANDPTHFLAQFASNFYFNDGNQDRFGGKEQYYLAWAVRNGDVAAVPVPGAVWLFLSGLMGLMYLKRQCRV